MPVLDWMWNMRDKTSICAFGGIIQRVKEMAGMGILCVFIILLGMLFVIVGIVWFLADCTVRKLEKVGCL